MLCVSVASVWVIVKSTLRLMYHTPAFILRKAELGEADLLVTALSRDFGKIRLRAQGARKHGAKLQGHLEVGSLSDISFVFSRNGYRLTTARCRSCGIPTAVQWSARAASLQMFRVLDENLWEDREHAHEFFSFTRDALALLQEIAVSSSAAERVVVWFTLQILRVLGNGISPYTPEAFGCEELVALGDLPAYAILNYHENHNAFWSELERFVKQSGTGIRLPPRVIHAPSIL